MNALKKFSVDTHKGWSSFQKWIKKWNKIMAVIFGALATILILSAVIVNALDAHEKAQEDLKKTHKEIKVSQVCHWIQIKSCRIYCNFGTSTALSNELSILWAMNSLCHSEGINIEISSFVHFPKFTIQSDWLQGDFRINQLQIDLENIFEIRENAFTAEVFESMNKLIFNNLHLSSLGVDVIRKLFINQNYKHLTITKKLYSEQLLSATMTHMNNYDSVIYMEFNAKYEDRNLANLEDITLFKDISQSLIIGLTIVGCILSFALGFVIRYNLFEQKNISNKNNKTNRMIFLVEKDVSCISKYYCKENEKNENPFAILSKNGDPNGTLYRTDFSIVWIPK